MHINKVKKFYKKAERNSIDAKSPMEVVKAMVTELHRSMKTVAGTTQNNEKRLVRSKHFSRSLVLIYTLQTSLDFEHGGNLATQLFQLYEYCRQQLIKGFKNQLIDGIQKAINALDEIFFIEKKEESINV